MCEVNMVGLTFCKNKNKKNQTSNFIFWHLNITREYNIARNKNNNNKMPSNVDFLAIDY